jgi:hypothetical protein
MSRGAQLRPLTWIVLAQVTLYTAFGLWTQARVGKLEGWGLDAFGRLLQADLPALLPLTATGLVGLALAKRGRGALRLVHLVESAPWVAAIATTLLCALLSLGAVGARPLAMDEVAPLYQARVFAHAQLYARVAPDAVDWLFFPPFSTGFFTVSPKLGHAVSFYWPGFALAMAPFEVVGAGFLLNPLLAGGSMLLIRNVALGISSGDRKVAGTAMLLLASAPAFAVNAATYYAMNAHLFANLAFVALLLRPSGLRLWAAGSVGAWALSMHNPFPHFVFALPWLLAQMAPADRVRRVACLALGYVPLSLLLVVAWHFYRQGLLPPKHGVPGVSTSRMLAFGFELPSLVTLEYRSLGVGKLMAWSSFGLLPLAVLGALRQRRNQHVKLLAASALLTLAAYLVSPYSQGHGWGYRYFHPAFMTLPLLAALALSSDPGPLPRPDAADTSLLAVANSWWMLGGLLVCLPLRALQVRDFMAAHYRQRSTLGKADEQCVHFMKTQAGYYVADLIYNDPWLKGRDIYLTSHGLLDAELVRRSLPTATLRGTTSTDVTYCAPSLDPLRNRLLSAAPH